MAIRSFAGKQLSRGFHLAAKAIEVGEKWCARRAKSVVVIAESFRDVHRRWRTDHKVTVIPNWAPLDEIYPVNRKNDWAVPSTGSTTPRPCSTQAPWGSSTTLPCWCDLPDRSSTQASR